MHLNELQQYVKAWIEEIGETNWTKWNYFSRLVEEVGEVGEQLSLSEGVKRHKSFDKAQLEEELGDILFVLAALSNELGIDLETAFEMMRAKHKRKFGDIDRALTGDR
ncbi:nucleotide pyrophosphohydrolase [Candidatus Woesearchaeota archaeon CG08_land_8_20_14_0_20_47_9]|nr:MAG: hypothetical protein AUJ69_00375 [Candidatus Woesearchaeota archaeon CG1_02_47_18]PIN76724.1 MAG: nucleotide pyrophosphohydrolase [Candidatus Woesearchaeota archaeon CG10_big_fil_rev_8_21_14_0_10_47_5]PIO04040.1 MAG: nucleotide pyrophosphohydrolase [Candidatus Woesearchaeota archaeon CG08_land_8_20_14_0_20_47_9]HII29949.1 nucleotide pyrophosphohydrolase [Candidatus Woesearchaeota archaeon]